jgi:hypothetical protein
MSTPRNPNAKPHPKARGPRPPTLEERARLREKELEDAKLALAASPDDLDLQHRVEECKNANSHFLTHEQYTGRIQRALTLLSFVGPHTAARLLGEEIGISTRSAREWLARALSTSNMDVVTMREAMLIRLETLIANAAKDGDHRGAIEGVKAISRIAGLEAKIAIEVEVSAIPVARPPVLERMMADRETFLPMIVCFQTTGSLPSIEELNGFEKTRHVPARILSAMHASLERLTKSVDNWERDAGVFQAAAELAAPKAEARPLTDWASRRPQPMPLSLPEAPPTTSGALPQCTRRRTRRPARPPPPHEAKPIRSSPKTSSSGTSPTSTPEPASPRARRTFVTNEAPRDLDRQQARSRARHGARQDAHAAVSATGARARRALHVARLIAMGPAQRRLRERPRKRRRARCVPRRP